ncbi:DUF5302 domain-containing protein [Phycicoccus avicenniae]|uniref:DUF5302 domain-containing protein n=1 Tax=Phycicoccus avicenniae TaxID=2828860 RepID=UPI003D264F89
MSAKDRPRAEVDEDVKAKFRAALDAKKAHGGTDVSDHSGRSKVDHAHGPETSAREQMFRRKSGS